jgi:hypothetical protein
MRRKKREYDDFTKATAENYVRNCLAIMDGSAAAGIARIGSERYEQTIADVLAVLP